MKDEMKIQSTSGPKPSSRRNHEFEVNDFSMYVNRLIQYLFKLLTKCRIAFLTLKEHLIIMIGVLILTAVILWTFDSSDNE